MSRAPKNECPGAAGQVVKTLSKHTTDFIAKLAEFKAIDYAFAACCVLLLAAMVTAIGGH